ncbi:MAG: serine/threonine protein kinase, partial [Chloroflexi bacterium]|nr:serine/threonine protein kinase [Chloroflexota bacterium]
MKPEELRELGKLFHAARALPESQRRRYVAEQCADRPAMREALENLLSADTEATVPVDRPAVQPPSGSEAPLPAQIGPYRILRTLGAGGMGVVYEAEQSQPVRRHVALKLIKLGMDTKQVIARFETERQALALMNHPNVAKVLDAGATEKGRPYFVMEYVKGESITAYCDRHRLTTKERLGLFMQVCQAVQHTHQKGIIHRDIKPSNVLVT